MPLSVSCPSFFSASYCILTPFPPITGINHQHLPNFLHPMTYSALLYPLDKESDHTPPPAWQTNHTATSGTLGQLSKSGENEHFPFIFCFLLQKCFSDVLAAMTSFYNGKLKGSGSDLCELLTTWSLDHIFKIRSFCHFSILPLCHFSPQFLRFLSRKSHPLSRNRSSLVLKQHILNDQLLRLLAWNFISPHQPIYHWLPSFLTSLQPTTQSITRHSCLFLRRIHGSHHLSNHCMQLWFRPGQPSMLLLLAQVASPLQH